MLFNTVFSRVNDSFILFTCVSVVERFPHCMLIAMSEVRDPQTEKEVCTAFLPCLSDFFVDNRE